MIQNGILTTRRAKVDTTTSAQGSGDYECGDDHVANGFSLALPPLSLSIEHYNNLGGEQYSSEGHGSILYEEKSPLRCVETKTSLEADTPCLYHWLRGPRKHPLRGEMPVKASGA